MKLSRSRISRTVRSRLSSATHAAFEKLDHRVMFSSGDLDPTFSNLAGISGLAGETNPLFQPLTVPLTSLDESIITNRSNAVAIEVGGKIVTVGTTHTSDVRPGGISVGSIPPKTSNNFSINRYLIDGTLDTFAVTDFTDISVRGNPNLPDYVDIAVDVATNASDDSIIVAGTSIHGGATYIALSKYNFALSLQLATREDFHHDADVTGSTGAAFDVPGYVTSMAVASDGSIYVVGSIGNSATNTNMAIWKFTPGFALDPSFGAGGMFTFPLESYSADQFVDTAIAPDGSIYAVGVEDTRTFDQFNGHQKFIVAKFTTAGALDTTFDGDGLAEVADFGLNNAAATAVTVQADNRPVVAGYGAGVGQIVRFTTAGSLDTSFGARGRLSVAGVKPALNLDLNVQADGNLIMSGDSQSVAGGYFTARIRSEGSLDINDASTTPPRVGYSVDGKTNTGPLIAPDNITSATTGRAAIQADGKIILAGGFGDTYAPSTFFDPNPLTFTGTVGFSDVLARFLGDARPPVPILTALDHTDTNPYSVVVTIIDDVLTNANSISAGDFAIVYPDGSSHTPTSATVTTSAGGKVASVTLLVPPPGGTWDKSDSSTTSYQVRLIGNITDQDGNAIAGNNASLTPVNTASTTNFLALGSFQVRINPPTIIPPSSTLNASAVINPALQPKLPNALTQLYRFTVTYADDVAVNGATIGPGDVIVTGPNFFSQVAAVNPVGAAFSDGKSITVEYQITAPGGTFDITDNGTYTVTMAANQVSDTDLTPNYVPSGVLGQFGVSVSSTGGNGNGGTTGGAVPTAVVAGGLPTTSSTTTRDFTVVFSDDVGLDFSTLNNNSSAVRVTGPRLYSQLATFKSISAGTNTTPISVTYTVTGPDGTFDPSDNGLYSVSILPDLIKDIDPTPNFFPAGTVGTFSVNVSYAPVSNGRLVLSGTDFGDNISLTADATNYRVVVNNNVQLVARSLVTSGITVSGFSGADSITLGEGVSGATVGGGLGNDSIFGSTGDDLLQGGRGDDVLRGNGGNDVLYGQIGDDNVAGGIGNDSLGGGQGNDVLFGGVGDDTLFGGIGTDNLDGGVGNDSIRARDLARDTLTGGDGTDTALSDDGTDVLTDAFEVLA